MMEVMDDIDVSRDLLLKHPFTCLTAGSTSSGKTTVVSRIIANLPSLITPDLPLPIRVMWCTGSYSSIPVKSSKAVNIETVIGAPPDDMECDVLVIDDQMADMADSKKMCDLFTKHSHHK